MSEVSSFTRTRQEYAPQAAECSCCVCLLAKALRCIRRGALAAAFPPLRTPLLHECTQPEKQQNRREAGLFLGGLAPLQLQHGQFAEMGAVKLLQERPRLGGRAHALQTSSVLNTSTEKFLETPLLEDFESGC